MQWWSKNCNSKNVYTFFNGPVSVCFKSNFKPTNGKLSKIELHNGFSHGNFENFPKQPIFITSVSTLFSRILAAQNFHRINLSHMQPQNLKCEDHRIHCYHWYSRDDWKVFHLWRSLYWRGRDALCWKVCFLL